MAAALRAAEGGVYFFPNPQGGVFSKFFRPGGGIPPNPYSRHLLGRLVCKGVRATTCAPYVGSPDTVTQVCHSMDLKGNVLIKYYNRGIENKHKIQVRKHFRNRGINFDSFPLERIMLISYFISYNFYCQNIFNDTIVK